MRVRRVACRRRFLAEARAARTGAIRAGDCGRGGAGRRERRARARIAGRRLPLSRLRAAESAGRPAVRLLQSRPARRCAGDCRCAPAADGAARRLSRGGRVPGHRQRGRHPARGAGRRWAALRRQALSQGHRARFPAARHPDAFRRRDRRSRARARRFRWHGLRAPRVHSRRHARGDDARGSAAEVRHPAHRGRDRLRVERHPRAPHPASRPQARERADPHEDAACAGAHRLRHRLDRGGDATLHERRAHDQVRSAGGADRRARREGRLVVARHDRAGGGERRAIRSTASPSR